MKKILLTVLLVSATIATQAQVSLSKLSYGVKLGLNASNVSAADQSTDAHAGFQIGGFVEYAISPYLAIQPGLEYTLKGFNAKYVDGIVPYQDKTSAGYLEIPINVVYKLDVAPGWKVTFNAGPYFGFGVAGSKSSTYTSASVTHTDKVDTFSNLGGLNTFDFGLGAGVGVECGHYIANLGFEGGLTDISRGSHAGSVRNTNAFLSIGYKF